MINPFRTGGVFGLRLVSCIGFQIFGFRVLFEVSSKFGKNFSFLILVVLSCTQC